MVIRWRRATRGRRVLLAFLLVMAAVGLVACSTSARSDGPAASTATPSPEGELPEELRSELQGALDETMAEYQVPGAVAGVWAPGQGSWTSATGLADVDSRTAVSPEMTWPLRSVTKSFTVTLLLQLVDDGAVGLDDTIGEYVDGVTNGDTITLRMLANMSSGNADYTGAEFLEVYTADPNQVFTLQQLNGFVLGEPEQFAPGAERIYTNANTNLLGAVIEEVTGDPFDEVLNDRILAPLGLGRTDYLADGGDWADPHPSGYVPGEDGPEEQPQNFSIFGPAGAMVTSLEDARVWGRALATGRLLSPQTQAERLEGAPLDQGPPYGIYALGIGRTNGWWGHNGEGIGFTTALFHHRESDTTVAVFMNASQVAPDVHPADEMFRRAALILERS